MKESLVLMVVALTSVLFVSVKPAFADKPLGAPDATGIFEETRISQERVVFEITVPHAIQLYEATKGMRIKTSEEFMEHIIRANQIQLPELPAGQRYIYEPLSGELMVEKPAG